MKLFNLIFVLILACSGLSAQKYFTKSGHILFASDAPLEKIEGHNDKATCVIDATNGKMEWAVLVKAFRFEKALMQEHFNENYMESSKFPKAKFKGQIENIESVNFSNDGTYPIDVTGQLTIHGVTQELIAKAKIKILNGEVEGTSLFNLLVADFEIDIPGVVKDNIAKEVTITVSANYQLLDK